jgi:hypothetical protein
VSEWAGYLPHEADHIISEKHGGLTTADNLCLSCFECNRFKGSDIGSIDLETSTIVFLFNPRKMLWWDHFRLDGAWIVLLTPEGRVTEFLLRLNSPVRVKKREGLLLLGDYPCNPDS